MFFFFLYYTGGEGILGRGAPYAISYQRFEDAAERGDENAEIGGGRRGVVGRRPVAYAERSGQR